MVTKTQTDRPIGLSLPSFIFIMSMDNNSSATGLILLFIIVLLPVAVHAQDGSLAIPPPLFQPVPEVAFKDDKLLNQFNQGVSFGWNLKILGEDIAEVFTFDPDRLAELKLKHAEERQKEIDALDFVGLPIPIEYEERRIQKLNEAREIVNQRVLDTPSVADSKLSGVIESFKMLRNMGELNDIRILYSQLPRVMNAGDEVKERYNDRVNSLQTWKDSCKGEFDIDSLGSLKNAVSNLEEQCPRLLELQEQFGTERLQSLVRGTI